VATGFEVKSVDTAFVESGLWRGVNLWIEFYE
jgi:hypothetical protein